MDGDWTTINATKPAVGTPECYDDAKQLLNWCWVAKLERFVSISDASQQYKLKAFDEVFGHLKLPPQLTPSSYIKELNQEYRLVSHLEMLPSERALIMKDRHGLKVLNVFRHAPEPLVQVTATPDRFLDHLLWLLNGQQESLKHVLMWIAHLLFKPEQRLNHGILISGNQGTGKTTIADVVKELAGPSSKTITTKYLKSDFQDWMVNARLVVVEEIKEMGNHSLYNNIKTFFTDNVLHINPKGGVSYDIANHLHFMMFSNYPYPIKLESGDRRIFYVHSNVTKKEDSYYIELRRYLEEGGTWAFRKYLQEHVLPTIPDGFAFTAPPSTPDHIASVSSSLNPIEEYIMEKRDEGLGLFAPKKFFLWLIGPH